MQSYCEAVFTSPQLSDKALGALGGMTAVDWASLWSLILAHGAPIVVAAIEAVIPTLPIGAIGKTIISAVVAELAKLVPSA